MKGKEFQMFYMKYSSCIIAATQVLTFSPWQCTFGTYLSELDLDLNITSKNAAGLLIAEDQIYLKILRDKDLNIFLINPLIESFLKQTTQNKLHQKYIIFPNICVNQCN